VTREDNKAIKPENILTSHQAQAALDYQGLFAALPGLYLVLTPSFVIVDGSDAYFQATMTKREEVIGRLVFDVFPDNPSDPNADGVKNLRASLENVLKYRKPHTMAIQKYDIRRPEAAGGGFEERYWSPLNSPVFHANGEITYIINRAEDVTEFVRLKQQESEQCRINQALQIRNKQIEAEMYVTAQESAQREQALRDRSVAAQHQAEAAYKQVGQILESMTDGFVALDRDWRITYQNAAGEKVNGKPRTEIIGKTHWEVWAASVGTNIEYQYRRAMAQQIPVEFEHRYYEPPDYDVWLEIRAYPNEDGLAIFYRDITERKRIEAVQRESEAKLRFILDSSEIGEWDLDLTTQPYTTYRSLKHDQIFGYASLLPEWSYEIFLTHVHPDDRIGIDEKFQQTLSNYADWDFECRIIHPDQSIHYIWARSSVYRDINGIPIRLLGMVVDITERKRESEALRESERRFRRLVESNLFGIVFGDSFGKLHYANDYLLNLLGYTLEEFQSEQIRWDELTPPEFGALDAQAVEQLIARGVCEPYEKVYLHKNGRRISILIAAALLQEPYNEIQEVIAFILDLTELKRVSLERDRFFNLSSDMLAIGNLEGYFTQLNPAWEKYLGFSQTQLKAQPYLDFVHPDDKDATLFEAQKLAQGCETIGFSNRYRTASGSYRWISWNVVPFREENIFYAVARDITNSKLAQIEREQLLLREQIAREAAERASRIKDEFLAVLSHELRSPLNPILGWSKLLQSGRLDPAKTIEAHAIIERNAKLQVQLIDDLLDVSRILRGKLVLNAAPLNLGNVILAAIDTVQLVGNAKSIQIITQINPAVSVIGDATRLQQVVWNLLSNAVKFTPKSGKIEVYLRSISNNAQIQVIDTGKGISQEFLPDVFEHFRQEDGSTTRKFGGLGLGLAIVRQIVELHGGTVAADSPGVGQGATFTVQIPLCENVVLSPIPHTDTSLNLNGINILVVDDDSDSREFIAFILEQQQAKVTAVASGLEALEVLTIAPYDLLISDIGMPQMDGYMLIQAIRAKEQGKSILALALTAYAGEFNEQQAINAGFQKHISKPIDANVVIESARALVKHLL
jgi:PAS domain S-box-containing protein